MLRFAMFPAREEAVITLRRAGRQIDVNALQPEKTELPSFNKLEPDSNVTVDKSSQS
jgi:hypothetical protein